MDFNARYNNLLQLLDLSPQDRKKCAKSTYQQCRCKVAAKSRDEAAQILLTIATTNPTVKSAKQGIVVIAELL
jgi:hypothetical protein